MNVTDTNQDDSQQHTDAGTMHVREQLTQRLQQALNNLLDQGVFCLTPAAETEDGETPVCPRVHLSPPKQASHGDFACNIAMALAKLVRRAPRDIAAALQEELGNADGMLDKVEVAGAGFLNLFVNQATWHQALASVLQEGPSFIRSRRGGGHKVMVEYVSANPTGPLHVAHGRGAVLGDVVSRLLDAAGYDVHREYYVNDLGHQTDVMGRSVHLRYGELLGRSFEAPEDFYPGEYLVDVARQLVDEFGDQYLDAPESAWLDLFRSRGIHAMLERIKNDLDAFGVRFDRFESEREMVERCDLPAMVKRLTDSGHVFSEGGRTWFRSTDYGDDKDRVIVRDDGRTTYFASDIAYHDDKLNRGYETLINVWGADHGGYVARVKAGLQALGYRGEQLEVLLVQMVSLSRGGEAVRMGKRLGTAVWLRDVIDEVGRDATRYFFIMRRSESQMDFDLDLATKKTLDNPVYYAQMGHARMCSIARRANEAGVAQPKVPRPDDVAAVHNALGALTLPEELGLIKMLCRAPDVVADAAVSREPHTVVHYIQDLIAQFHSYYTQYKKTEKVISDDAAKTRARLLLCSALQQVLAVLLEGILGVAAPEAMSLDDSGDKKGEGAAAPAAL